MIKKALRSEKRVERGVGEVLRSGRYTTVWR